MKIFFMLVFVLTIIALSDTARNSCICECKENDDGGLEDSSGLLHSNNKNEVLRAAKYPQNCEEAVGEGQISGIYMIQIRNSPIPPFFIYCQADPNGGPAWAIIQRRQDGSLDFYRNWVDYKNGFGNKLGEFFIGLDKVYALTHAAINELWIKLEDFDNQTRNAYYDSFAVGNENEKYALSLLGNYSGDAGDSLRYHEGHMWSTKDVKNDNYSSDNCAQTAHGGWWYFQCHASNLNGHYLRGSYGQEHYGEGVNWRDWHGYHYSLKYTHMAIRWKTV